MLQTFDQSTLDHLHSILSIHVREAWKLVRNSINIVEREKLAAGY